MRRCGLGGVEGGIGGDDSASATPHALNACYCRAKALITRQREALDILTHALVSERNLDEEDIGLLLGPRPWVIR